MVKSKYDIYFTEVRDLLNDKTLRQAIKDISERDGLSLEGFYYWAKKQDFESENENFDVGDGALVTKRENQEGFEMDVYSTFIKTLDDLIKYHKIDTKVFKAVEVITNYLEQGSKLRVPHQTSNGKVVIKHKRTKTPLHQIKAKFKRIENLFDQERFIKDLKKAVGPIKTKKRKARPKKADLLVEPFITDHHIGNAIQNEDYDLIYSIDIAAKYYDRAIDSFLAEIDTSRIERFLLPTGNDLVHWDNFKNQTTKGTQLFGNARDYERACVVAEAVLIRNIDKLSKIAPVDVPMVKSNHSYATEFHIGRSLIYKYQKDKNVTINNSTYSRQYYQWKGIGIGFCHGHNEKINELDKIFPVEKPGIWNESTTRHFHIGHRHKFVKTSSYTKLIENMRQNGLEVIQGSTLCVPDLWHTNKGYVGSYQRTQCLVFNPKYLQQILFWHPEND